MTTTAEQTSPAPVKAPPREGTFALPDGRRLGWLEDGVADGVPVFAFHGLPGSRRQRHPDASLAAAAGARIVHLERPGFGWSTPQRGRRLLDWPHDVAACADALGLERFAVLGISGGGPYALACAQMLGARVRRCAVVSGVGPPGTMRGTMAPLARLGFAVAPRWPALVQAVATPIARLALRAPDRYLARIAAHMHACDRPILARPAVRAMFAADYQAAFAQGVKAFVQDLALLAAPWGFTPAAVTAAVAFWHGEADRMVPPGASRALAAAIPGAETRFLAGEGHFNVFDRWPEVLEWLVRAEPVQG
jgi:pimeloyl-ACP methyl ester carboxylesterase